MLKPYKIFFYLDVAELVIKKLQDMQESFVWSQDELLDTVDFVNDGYRISVHTSGATFHPVDLLVKKKPILDLKRFPRYLDISGA